MYTLNTVDPTDDAGVDRDLARLCGYQSVPASATRPAAQLLSWLEYIGAVHPQSIAMGLERVSEVRRAMGLVPRFPIITVGGTNGKGSTCAMLEAMLSAAGHRVGCYTSPHLLRFNERIRVGRQSVSDGEIVAALEYVEASRRAIPLTYFEFTTLAAVKTFVDRGVDVAILEVGLGGRLDAVNIFDADCAVITGISIDHVDYLGDTREAIGYEKAGIFRTGRPAICADPDPPQSILHGARVIGAHLMRLGDAFHFGAMPGQWNFSGGDETIRDLPYPVLRGTFQVRNATAAIAALRTLGNLRFPVTREHIIAGLREARLPGRFQVLRESPTVVVDVAHNPEAAMSLAENLSTSGSFDRTLAVFAMLGDKDVAGVIDAVHRYIDCWLIADIRENRGAPADRLRDGVPDASIVSFEGPIQAYLEAMARAHAGDRIVVFGSFYTVAAVLAAQDVEAAQVSNH
jgi:dihydrofolate synthase/folylpolyglutamate synthase